MLYTTNLLIKKGAKMNVVWYGPAMPSVSCFRPETIKMVLKGL